MEIVAEAGAKNLTVEKAITPVLTAALLKALARRPFFFRQYWRLCTPDPFTKEFP
jgi:hypothetical protein